MALTLSNRALTNRLRRSAAAALVLLMHVALVWIVILIRASTPQEDPAAGKPIIVTFIDRPRNLALGAQPIHVEMENVLHLQRLAPKLQDIPVDKPEPPLTPVTVSLAASAPLPGAAIAGLNGEENETSGHSGGGYSITLLQRVVAKYPYTAARRREEGITRVALHVSSSGRVSDVKVIASSGSTELDRAAVVAFRKWKFARLPPAAPKDGLWLQTAQRFIVYQFRYSRIGNAADGVDVSAVKPATEEPTPQSKEALTRFISALEAGDTPDAAVGRALDEAEKMREVLEEWGAVKSIDFTGIAGDRRWMTYRPADGGPPVEVAWNMFEVRHQRVTSEWLVAVDRNGTIWSASASPVPLM